MFEMLCCFSIFFTTLLFPYYTTPSFSIKSVVT